MFTITIDGGFTVGDTREVNVNGKPTTLTYTDPGTLTLGGGETRKISYINCSLDPQDANGTRGFHQTFVCAEDATVIMPVASDDDIPF